MTEEADLLTVKEASAIYDPKLTPASFRLVICPILAEREGLRVRMGPTGKRRVIKIIPAVLLAYIQEEKRVKAI